MSLKHAATHFVQHFMAKLIFKRKNYARDFFQRNPSTTIKFERVFNATTCFMSYFGVRHYFRRFINSRTRFMSYYWARHYYQRFINSRALNLIEWSKLLFFQGTNQPK